MHSFVEELYDGKKGFILTIMDCNASKQSCTKTIYLIWIPPESTIYQSELQRLRATNPIEPAIDYSSIYQQSTKNYYLSPYITAKF